jgi:flap endonuclease-1
MLTHGITPVYVFDGPPPASKAPVVMKRRALEAAKGTRIDRVVFEEVIALLRMMNIPIVMAPGEAEAQCARMATRGIVDAVYTNDTDALVFGASCMIYTMRASSSITTIDRDMVLKKLALNNNQFIDLCILLGSDYTGTLPGIGYKKAYGMIKKHGSIEAILANESIICPMVFDYVLARREFANPAVSDVAAISMNIDNVNVEDIREFLVEVHGLEPARIRRSISKLATLVSAA